MLRVCKFASEEMCERENAILCAFNKESPPPPQLSAYNTRMDIYKEKSRSTPKSVWEKIIDGINRKIL